MHALSSSEIALLFLSLGVLLIVARVFGELAQLLSQPAVLGEILAGVLLGPTVLGALMPEAHAYLFPAEGPRAVVLDGLSSLAITLFLLVVGMEVDLSTIWRQGKAVLYVGIGGMVAPFAIAFALAAAAPGLFGGAGTVRPIVFAVFIGTAMSISAVPVVSKTLMDLGLYRTDFGMIIVAGAVVNDLAGWILFSIVLSTMGLSSGLGLMVEHTLALTLGFVVLILTVGRWLINLVLPWIQAYTSWPGGVLGFALALALLGAAFTEGIGVHAVLGSFLLGVAIGDSPHLREQTRATIGHFISFIFAPLFFAVIGLRIDFYANFDPWLVLVVCVVACSGKLLGCGVGARLAGMSPRESWAVGFGMNARGPMEIILGTLALDNGLITDRMFEALVIMALATSVIPGPVFQYLLRRKKPLRATDFLATKAFVSRLHANNRLEAIGELAKSAAATSDLDETEVRDAVWRREQTLATGIGHGVAVPHARMASAQQPVVAVGISPQGLDFDAPDGEAVHLVFLVVTPQHDNGAQLQILADIARSCMRPAFLERAASVENYTQFLALLRTS